MPSPHKPRPIESADHISSTERDAPIAAERVRAHIKLAQSRYNEWLENNPHDAPCRSTEMALLDWANVLLDHKVARTRLTIQKRIEIFGHVAEQCEDLDMLSEANLSDLKEILLRHLTFAKVGF